MIVTGKSIARRKPLFADFSVPKPPDWDGEGGQTLRDLIEIIVREEVAAFRKRQVERQFLKALTASEIEAAAESGKVQMGQSEVGRQHVDVDSAIATALQAFEDGLYLVVIDEQEYRSLEQAVFLHDDSHITFFRLTFLAGA